KTTCAAAAATRAAVEGQRVLVVSTDPAHSLGDALDAKLGLAPVRVAVPGAARGGALWAVQLDADRALHRWLREREDAFKTIAERGTYLDDEDVDRLFSLSLPGVDELVGLLELARLARGRDYDHVVVDTAPTGHTLRLLEMPETLRRFAQVLDDMHAKHRFLASSLGGSWRGDFADDAIASVERDADDLRAMLTDALHTSFTWVTLPEALPLAESEDGVRAIEALGVSVPKIVVNRVWPAPEAKHPCAYCTHRVALEGAQLGRIDRLFARKERIVVPAAVSEPRGVSALLGVARSVKERKTNERGGAETRGAEARGAELGWAAERGARASDSLGLMGLPGGVRLVLVGGKGGVGKTSVACAMAMGIAEAAKKKRVLVLSTDPAHSVGDAMSVSMGDEETAVPGAPRNLTFRELDAGKAFEAEKKRYRRAIDELFASIFRGKMDASFDRQVLEDLLDLAPPGLDELFAILSIVDALLPTKGARGKRAAYDVVVVDTAPTGHTLRLLELPASALEWVHAIMSVLLKYRHVVGLGDLAGDLTALAKQLRALIDLLRDRERTAFVAVARPAALPRLETERLLLKLRAMHVPVASVVVNAVTAPSCPRCDAAAALEAPEIARLDAIARRARARIVHAPAVYPPPRGAAALRAWCASWATRAMLGGRKR
ncbi:MAG: arsenite/tail-anchored protein-transporting ATPase, partial [Myxococcales bacterium]|nr:arsenite/tail-anchored protein-transporting ATPase [Myxococcales bacterium]